MNNLGLIYAILASVSWGLVYILCQKLLEKVSPITLVFIEFFTAALILLPLALFNLGSIKALASLDKTTIIFFFLYSGLIVLANFFIISTVKMLGASTASVFEISYPFFVVIFAFIFFKTPLNWQFLLGAILIFLGSLVILQTSK